MGIVVIGAVFIDIKGYSISPYIPAGRNAVNSGKNDVAFDLFVSKIEQLLDEMNQ